MATNKPNEVSPADPGTVVPSEAGPSRRELLVQGSKVAAGIGVAALLGNLGNWALSYAAGKEPVKIGILHSLSGTMAISEVSLRDTVMMAVDEINGKGGVMGRMIKPVVVDPASNWDLFAEKAKQLLLQDKVSVVFGCWTSVSRKSVLPVFEKNNGLLFYPVQYEGEECSRNVFYTGAAPNQQAVPAVDYLMSKEGGGFKKFYLLGTDYVYPRTTNKILRAMLLAKKVPAANIEEEYTPFHHQDYQTIVGKVKKFAAGGGGCVISTINGDSNVPFYKEFANQGLRAEDAPIMAFSVAEDELRGMTRPRWSGTWRRGIIIKASIRRRIRSSWPISRPTARRTTCLTVTSGSQTIRSKPPISASISGSKPSRRPGGLKSTRSERRSMAASSWRRVARS